MTLLDDERAILVRLLLENADKAIYESRAVLKISPNLTVNRAYYSMYYAAQAMLRAHGFSAKTHEGTNSVFFEKFVKTGNFPRELYKNFGKLETDRYTADYNPRADFSEDEAHARLNAAEDFVNEIKKRLNSPLPPSGAVPPL